jgi:hypothetical protein
VLLHNALVRGLALKHTLIDCVDRIILELNGEPGLTKTCQFLKLIKEGYNVTATSRSLSLSREHVSRIYKRKAVELVTQEFLLIIGHPNLLYRHWSNHIACNFVVERDNRCRCKPKRDKLPDKGLRFGLSLIVNLGGAS